MEAGRLEANGLRGVREAESQTLFCTYHDIRARKQKGERRKEYEIGEGTLGVRTKEGRREST